MQGGYNTNRRCNHKFTFCKDRGIDSVSGCVGDVRDMRTQHF